MVLMGLRADSSAGAGSMVRAVAVARRDASRCRPSRTLPQGRTSPATVSGVDVREVRRRVLPKDACQRAGKSRPTSPTLMTPVLLARRVPSGPYTPPGASKRASGQSCQAG